jgi:hypothetical protein
VIATFVVARIAAAIMLFLALARLPYGYYTLLRFVVCGTTAYGVYVTSTDRKQPGWAWAFGIIAVVFNPLIPVHLNRDAWAVIDILVALVLLVSLGFVNTVNDKFAVTP